MGHFCGTLNKSFMIPASYKKMTVLLLLSTTFFIATQAQTPTPSTPAKSTQPKIKYGVKGGLSQSELNTSTSQFTYVAGTRETIRNFPKSGFHVGGFATLPLFRNKKGGLSRFTLQPEVLFSLQGASGRTNGNLFTSTEQYDLYYVNIPVMLKYSFPSGIFFETGPQFGVLASSRIREDITGDPNYHYYATDRYFKRFDAGWGLGLGYLAPFNIGIDIRYTYGLTDINNAPTDRVVPTPVQNGHIMNSAFQLGLFYQFGKPRINPDDNL